jgi:hypothetical protein
MGLVGNIAGFVRKEVIQCLIVTYRGLIGAGPSKRARASDRIRDPTMPCDLERGGREAAPFCWGARNGARRGIRAFTFGQERCSLHKRAILCAAGQRMARWAAEIFASFRTILTMKYPMIAIAGMLVSAVTPGLALAQVHPIQGKTLVCGTLRTSFAMNGDVTFNRPLDGNRSGKLKVVQNPSFRNMKDLQVLDARGGFIIHFQHVNNSRYELEGERCTVSG